MDPIMLVAKLPPDVVDAISAYRMMSIQNELDQEAFRRANSMFVVRTYGASSVEEIQRQAMRTDAELTLALLNLVRVSSRNSEEVDAILAEWQSGHPGVFKK